MSALLAAALGIGGVGGALAHGAFHRNSPLFGRVLARLPEARRDGRPLVALTFDDGPDPATTPRVLDVLAREGVPATFFLLGRHVDRWPALARRAAEEGHALGNHGYAHRKLTFRRPSFVRDDVARGAAAIAAATDRRPRLFRAPHGFRSPWVAPIVRAQGERLVGWSLGVWDTDRPGADAIAARVVRGARPGAIVLLHDGDGSGAGGDRTQTAAALPRIIRELRARGFTFARLSDEPMPRPVRPAARR